MPRPSPLPAPLQPDHRAANGLVVPLVLLLLLLPHLHPWPYPTSHPLTHPDRALVTPYLSSRRARIPFDQSPLACSSGCLWASVPLDLLLLLVPEGRCCNQNVSGCCCPSLSYPTPKAAPYPLQHPHWAAGGHPHPFNCSWCWCQEVPACCRPSQSYPTPNPSSHPLQHLHRAAHGLQQLHGGIPGAREAGAGGGGAGGGGRVVVALVLRGACHVFGGGSVQLR